jgi:hypothetical protein
MRTVEVTRAAHRVLQGTETPVMNGGTRDRSGVVLGTARMVVQRLRLSSGTGRKRSRLWARVGKLPRRVSVLWIPSTNHFHLPLPLDEARSSRGCDLAENLSSRALAVNRYKRCVLRKDVLGGRTRSAILAVMRQLTYQSRLKATKISLLRSALSRMVAPPSTDERWNGLIVWFVPR